MRKSRRKRGMPPREKVHRFRPEELTTVTPVPDAVARGWVSPGWPGGDAPDLYPMVFRDGEDRIHIHGDSWAAIEDMGLSEAVFAVLEAGNLPGLERFLQESGFEYKKTHGGTVWG